MPKITSVRALTLRLPFDHGGPAPLFAGKPRSTLDSGLMRVELDNGLVGWGESYAPDPDALRSFVRSRIAPLVVGSEVDAVSTAGLDRTLHNMGRSGLVTHAISGLDIALWDLRGKLAGVPVYTLLGRAARTVIPAYASLLQYYGDEALIARNVDAALAAGYREVKLHERTVAATLAARRAMGNELALMLDTNCAWTPAQAHEIVDDFSALNLLWLEEPLWPPEDLDALAALKARTDIRLAAGENASSRYELETMVRRGLVDFLQPSALKAGGLTALAALSEQCAGTAVTLAPQSAFFGPGFLATLHVLAAQTQPVTVERLFCGLGHVPYQHTVRFEHGAFHLTDRPGLGADPEPELLAGPYVTT